MTSEIHDPATCKCARCSPQARKAMQISQRGKAAAERAVIEAAFEWADAFGDDAADRACERLSAAVERLREWREADRAGKARRRER